MESLAALDKRMMKHIFTHQKLNADKSNTIEKAIKGYFVDRKNERIYKKLKKGA